MRSTSRLSCAHSAFDSTTKKKQKTRIGIIPSRDFEFWFRDSRGGMHTCICMQELRGMSITSDCRRHRAAGPSCRPQLIAGWSHLIATTITNRRREREKRGEGFPSRRDLSSSRFHRPTYYQHIRPLSTYFPRVWYAVIHLNYTFPALSRHWSGWAGFWVDLDAGGGISVDAKFGGGIRGDLESFCDLWWVGFFYGVYRWLLGVLSMVVGDEGVSLE